MDRSIVGPHGVKWGLIISVVYCIFLLLRFEIGENNTLIFGGLAFVGYVIVLILLLVSGFNLRKKLGGYIELKEAFKALFYAVLIFEFAYAVFNFIYLKYINPDFFYNLKDATERMLIETKQPQAEIDKVLEGIDVDAPQKMNFFDVLKSYLFWVAITGALAFLMALIIKKKPDPYTNQNDFSDSRS
jgi:amino acid transporter